MELVGDPREGPSTERAFEAKPVPAWTELVTVRAVVTSLVLGAALSCVMMNLVFTSGIIPSLNISAGLLGFLLLKAWTRLLDQIGAPHSPFTRQENAVVQTCVVACAGMTYSGGFGSYLLAMDRRTAEKTSTRDAAGTNVSEPTLGRMMAFFFLVSFVGLLAIVPMRKTTITRHRLTFPSGSATAHLINSFHTPQGAKQSKEASVARCPVVPGRLVLVCLPVVLHWRAKLRLHFLPDVRARCVSSRFLHKFERNLRWGRDDQPLPDKHLDARRVHRLLGYHVAVHPKQKRELVRRPSPGQQFEEPQQVFGAIAMILGDGIFQLVVISLRTMHTMRHNQLAAETVRSFDAMPRQVLSFDDRRRTQVFVREHIPSTFAIGGYVLLATFSTIAIPHIYGQVRYYHVAAAYVFAPLLAFCNACGTGVAETNFSAQYNKLVILLFASWISVKNGGVVGSLVICGIVSSIVSTASDLRSDFKTGYLTLTSPQATLVSQVIGTGIGCVVNPVVFTVFHHFYEMNPRKTYQVPLAKVYRAIAVLGAGDLELPKHCLGISATLFALALATCALREVAAHGKWRAQQYIPSVTGMAVSFQLAPAVSIDMCVGSLILFLWNRKGRESAQVFAPVLASGLICGDGLFSIPYALLEMYDVTAHLHKVPWSATKRGAGCFPVEWSCTFLTKKWTFFPSPSSNTFDL